MPSAIHDDALFLEQAHTILNGQWLGTFNERTLIKGAMYPVFIAACSLLELSVRTVQHILYLSGAAFLCATLFIRGVKERWAAILFVLLAFNPVTVTDGASRFLRDMFYTGLFLWLFALLTYVVIVRPQKIFFLILCAGIGLITTALSLTREESIWLCPLLCSIGLIFLLRKEYLRIFAGMAILFFSWLGGTGIVKHENKIRYGLPILTEFQSPFFRNAYGALTRVKSSEFRRYVPVSREMREKLYDVSPSFQRLKTDLENSRWIQAGCRYIEPCDDHSSHFLWAFREAVARQGFYSSLSKAKSFYGKVTMEVNDACSKSLKCRSQCSSFLPPLRREYLTPWFKTFFRGLWLAGSFSSLSPSTAPKFELNETEKSFRALTGEKESEPDMSLSGWIVDKTDQPLTLSLSDGELERHLFLMPSEDVHQAFSIVENARRARFSFVSPCKPSCLLRAKHNDEIMLEIELPSKTVKVKASNVEFFIDQILMRPSGKVIAHAFFKKTLLFISKIYKVFFVIVSPLALILFFRSVFFRRESFHRPLILISVLALIAFLTRAALLSLLDVTSFEGINPIYFMPVYSLVIIFVWASMYDTFENNLEEI